MRTSIKIAAFAAGLVAVFGAATAIGTAVGPVEATVAEEPHGGHEDGAPATDAAAELPGGLMVSQDGYTLDLITRQLPASANASVELRILGPDGTPVTDYATEHGKELHLITARRDLTGFQHVHPRRDGSGTWSVTLNAAIPGAYRIFADFRPADREDGLTLGSDLAVAGAYDPRPFPQDSRVSTVDDYTVDLQGELTPGTDSKLTLSVSKAGAPVTDLDPYLEAYGHLVALRDGDLAYLHVHPGGTPDDGTTPAGPSIEFFANIPSPGRYRLFLDYSHRGVVRTAEFTVTATYGAAGPSETASPAATKAPSTQAPSPEPSTTRVPVRYRIRGSRR